MDALRKTYQRAVQIPLNNVEQIWQEYNQFENNMSKMTVSRHPICSAPCLPLRRSELERLRLSREFELTSRLHLSSRCVIITLLLFLA